MSTSFRRIVTDHDENGTSIIRSTDVLTPQPIPSGDAAFQLAWTTPTVPVDLNAGTDGPMVQRATNHLWRNPSTHTVCRIAFVLIEATPVRVNGQILPEIHP